MPTEVLDSNFSSKHEFKEFDFPITFKFKISTLANDFSAYDANGGLIAYVRQKMFKFKEAILIYSDESKTNVLYKIDADRIIDFNACYAFSDGAGNPVGKLGRKGMRSLLKAHYEIFDNEGKHEYAIREENPWSKVFDALLCEVPLLGLFSGYMFNPRYVVQTADGTLVARLSKQKSFFGRTFKLEKLQNLEAGDGERMMLALMMMVLLERRRG
ncbi:MAG: hypothetical protein HYZ14_10560 [Bacteroidetes bacterium]|nr:hypothetical protein [Bacteroidota bacterium]